ncbi:MAG: RNA polymerase sigma factor [Planctomycetota bacterium]|jgi:RNA polymerase sigma-70 factor (ECF subfamily)
MTPDQDPESVADGDPCDDSGGPYQTDWSMLHEAIREGDEADMVLARVLQRYWPAVFGYLRAWGVNEDEACDITQGFMCDVVLGRRLLEAADPNRGRFRSLLLGSLRHYLSDVHRRRQAQKRRPQGHQVLALEEVGANGTVPDGTAAPEQVFCAQWGRTLVRRVLDRVRRQCLDDGMQTHWAVFEARVVRPMLFGDEPLEYRELRRRLPLTSDSQGPNMMVTVKRRFVAALTQEVALTVSDPDEVADEIADLLRDLEFTA